MKLAGGIFDLRQMYGPNFGPNFDPHTQNISTNSEMREAHHCEDGSTHAKSRRCFLNLHFAYCMAELEDEDGNAIRDEYGNIMFCHEIFTVISPGGCATHPYNHGHNLAFRESRRGKVINNPWENLKRLGPVDLEATGVEMVENDDDKDEAETSTRRPRRMANLKKEQRAQAWYNEFELNDVAENAVEDDSNDNPAPPGQRALTFDLPTHSLSLKDQPKRAMTEVKSRAEKKAEKQARSVARVQLQIEAKKAEEEQTKKGRTNAKVQDKNKLKGSWLLSKLKTVHKKKG